MHIGPGVRIITDNHPINPLERRLKATHWALPVVIEDDVLVGPGVQIMSGVTIGKGSTIEAGAVVTENIPSLSLAVGVPAKVVRTISLAN